MPGISHAAIVETGTYEIITSSGDFVSLVGVMPGSGNTRIMPGPPRGCRQRDVVDGDGTWRCYRR
jgi:hypothetical protein